MLPTPGAPAVEARGLRKAYGEHVAVNGVDLTIGRGEIVGFLGPNGAGKTTTIKMLTGLLKPTAGSAAILGHDIERDPIAAKAAFGYVPDTPNLYGKLGADSRAEAVARGRSLGLLPLDGATFGSEMAGV